MGCFLTLRHYIPSCTFLKIKKKSLKIKSKNHLVKLSILFTLFTSISLESTIERQKSSHIHRDWHYYYGHNFSSSRTINSRTRIIIYVCKSTVGHIWNSDSDCRMCYFGNRNRFKFYQKKLNYTQCYCTANFA